MKPKNVYVLDRITVKEFDAGIILQKGKDMIFLNEEQFEVFTKVFNSLVNKESEK